MNVLKQTTDGDLDEEEEVSKPPKSIMTSLENICFLHNDDCVVVTAVNVCIFRKHKRDLNENRYSSTQH